MATAHEASVERIEELVGRIEAIPDMAARQAARQLMESILELHGSGLNRIMEIAFEAGDEGQALIRRFAADKLLSALLILHDLHPDDLSTRVQHALSKWHGSAELIGEFQGVVRVRLTGSGCGMQDAVETAIREAAPDAVEIVIDEALPQAGFVPLSALSVSISMATRQGAD
jgi:hypothetical protein